MKTYKYNILTILLFFGVMLQGQTFDKKIKENFKVNSDVEIVVNAAHMDVDIETWNRNEVSIVATMEVEGVDKDEAEEILNKWGFEALGNKNKIKVSSLSDNVFVEFQHNIDFDFDFPEIDVVIPHFEMPEIEFPEIPELSELPEIPEIPEMEAFEFDYELYKNDSTYLKNYKIKIAEGVKKFKNSNWKKKFDSLRNSEGYKLKMIEFKKATEKMKKELREMRNSEEFKQTIEEAKRVAKEATRNALENKALIKEQVRIAKEASKHALEEVRRLKEEGKLEGGNENIYFNFSTDKKSNIKIRKSLKIKVPKKATFDLDVRHGKVTIPESNKKLSVNMSYSNFIGGEITGTKNELVFTNSPVIIETLDFSNITLKNVPNAEFGTFNNVNLFSNSSDVRIDEVGIDVALSNKFGNIVIEKISPDFKTLNIILDYAKATVNSSNTNYVFKINGKKSTFKLNEKLTKLIDENSGGIKTIEGYHSDKKSINKLFLTGVFSAINLN